MNGTARRLVEAIGIAASLAGLAWVIVPVVSDLGTAAAGISAGALTTRIVLAAIAYGGASLLLATAWWWLTGARSARPALRSGWRVWLRTQVAKYLPGNLFHYVGRHAMGRALGLSHLSLVLAGALELVSLTIAALVLSSGFLLDSDLLSRVPPSRLVALGLLVLLGVVFVGVAQRRVGRSSPGAPALQALRLRELPALVGPALLLHLLFFCTTGLLVLALLRGGWPDAEVPLGRTIGIYCAAWISGTFVLGAPGGLGVREAVIAAALADPIGMPAASLLALAVRAVTIGGDAVAAALGYLIGRSGGAGPRAGTGDLSHAPAPTANTSAIPGSKGTP